MIRLNHRLRKLELVLVVERTPAPARDEEFEMISRQDSEAVALLCEADAIVREAVKDRPDRELLYADQKRLYAAMDVPALERLYACVDALHARVDSLRERREGVGQRNGQAEAPTEAYKGA